MVLIKSMGVTSDFKERLSHSLSLQVLAGTVFGASAGGGVGSFYAALKNMPVGRTGGLAALNTGIVSAFFFTARSALEQADGATPLTASGMAGAVTGMALGALSGRQAGWAGLQFGTAALIGHVGFVAAVRESDGGKEGDESESSAIMGWMADKWPEWAPFRPMSDEEYREKVEARLRKVQERQAAIRQLTREADEAYTKSLDGEQANTTTTTTTTGDTGVDASK